MLPTVRNRTSASPFRVLWDAQREVDRLFDGLTTSGMLPSTGWDMAADVRESKDALEVDIEIPGMDPDAIDVTVENNVLNVSGEKTTRREQEEGMDYRLVERRHGRFARAFTLPRTVDADRISASYEHGVLHITLPKSEKAKPRRITVSGGNGGREIETARES